MTSTKTYTATIHSPSADLTERMTVCAVSAQSALWQVENIYGPVFDDAIITIRIAK